MDYPVVNLGPSGNIISYYSRDWVVPKPKLVLLENVAGLLTSTDGKDLRDLLGALSDLGYAVDLNVIMPPILFRRAVYVSSL